MTAPTPPLNAVLDRFDGPVAVLRFPDGQLLRVPAAALPGIKLGEAVSLDTRHGAAGAAEREALAREVLNQLLAEQ